MALNHKYRELKAIALTAIAATLFLARGKLILDFYVLSILPLLAMCIGMMLTLPLQWGKEHISPRNYTIALSFIIGVIFLSSSWSTSYKKDETTNQDQAMTWVANNVPITSHIAMDDYDYPYLHDDKNYLNADWFQKIQLDSAVNSKYAENWTKIDYIILSHDMVKAIKNGQAPLVHQALSHSQLIADFRTGSTSHINLQQYISTNGDWAQVYKVDHKDSGLLVDSWRTYKQNYISIDGQVSDPQTSSTTSEGQSYAMLRAVYANDRATFDLVWNWTQKNMQVRGTDKLLAWKYMINKDGSSQLYDKNAATDADEDIAYSLILANKAWVSPTYKIEARGIVQDIWKNEVVSSQNNLYVVAAPVQTSGGQLLVNPSYLAPTNYRAFANIDPGHNWTKLVDDSYSLLIRIQARSPAKLFSNWIAVNPDGTLSSADGLGVSDANTYGYDAFRVNWRMATDKQDPRAQAILKGLTDFYQKEWSTTHQISSDYDLNGNPQTTFSDIPTSAGAVIGLNAIGNPLASQIYSAEIMSRYHASGDYWAQNWNYYSQNWAAFAVQYLGVGGKGTVGNKF